ncbi:MAG TPA: pilus assembly protein PilM [Nitrospira sp.]|nr:pilus assembly protein PilM [Nitrospira sp.]
MVADCVGLDIGQTAIKAVRFRRRLTGRETVEYFHQPLPYGRPEIAEPAKRAGALRTFLWQHGLYGSGDIVTALPCQDLFIRTLSFPFRDAAKLEQVVPFEVENLIPMALDDVAMGSVLLPPKGLPDGSQKPKGADVLVTAAPKDKVAEHLRFLAAADLKPAAIGVDGMALYSVTKFLQEEGAHVPGNLAIIDVGATKTTLCLIQEGRPALLRTVLWGGNHLTHALAVRYACSFAEAERRKRAMAVQEVDTWLEPLLKELRVSLHGYEGAAHQRLSHCWVSGGGSKLRELSGHVAHELGLTPVGPRQGFGSNCPRAFSIAFGLAIHPKIVRPRWKTKTIGSDVALDLNATADSASAQREVSRHDRRLALWGGLILGCLALLDLSIRVMVKESTLKEMKQGLQAQFAQSFGAGATSGEELDVARYRVAQLDKSLAVIDGGRNDVLARLSELAKQLPAGIPLMIRELTIEGAAVHLEGETSSFDAVDKIKQAFMANPVYQGTSVTDTRVGAAANQVVFRLAYTVQRP